MLAEYEVYCQSCGKKFATRFMGHYHDWVCGRECWRDLQWLIDLSIVDAEYTPRPVGEPGAEHRDANKP